MKLTLIKKVLKEYCLKNDYRRMSLGFRYIIFFVINFALLAEKNPNGQFLLEKLDRENTLNPGLYEGSIIYKDKNFDIITRKFKLFTDGENYRFNFTKKGEKHFKFLSYSKQEKIYYSLSPPGLTSSPSIEEYHETILSSNISILDLSHFSFEKNFLIEKMQTYQPGKIEYWKLVTKPVLDYNYSRVEFLFFKSSNKLYRIDYFDKNGILTRIVKYSENDLSQHGKKFIFELEAIDPDSGSRTKLVFHRVIEEPKVSEEFFKLENLNIK
ncbi:MAG: outer membrane lipoprotein-sorting protein [Leptospiraceae bacterium]|nr:outer membrane lipoprotein-sorting protein [Leptospiraceae bacterium]